MDNIKIVKQKYPNECGVCVLTSFHNYYFKDRQIEKSKVINIANLKKQGISIYDLEILGEKLNLILDTYECEYDEFHEYKINDFFVLALNQKFGYHYVIAKKTEQFITIYDTNDQIKKYTFEEFKDLYAGFFIIVTPKQNYKEIEENNIKNNLNFYMPNNYWYYCAVILLDLIFLMLSIISSSFLKIAIDKLIPNQLIEEIFFIGIFFMIIYLSKFIGDYFNYLLKTYYLQFIIKKNIMIYSQILSKKTNHFFNKIDKKIVYEYPSALISLINKKYLNDPNLISDIIYTFAILFLISTTSYLYLLGSLFYLLLIFVIGWVKKNNNEQYFEKLNIEKNNIDIKYNNFYDFLVNEKDKMKQEYLLNEIHKSCFNHNKNHVNYSVKMTFYDVLDHSISKIIYCILIMLSCYFIINNTNKNVTLSSMIYCMTLTTLLNSSYSNIFNYLSNLGNWKKSKILLKDFLEIENKKLNNEGLILEKIENIVIKKLNYEIDGKVIFRDDNFQLSNNSLIIGKNGSGKTTLMKILALQLTNANYESIEFNEVNLNLLNQEWLDENIIYLPSKSSNKKLFITELINDEDLDIKNAMINILKLTKIKFNENNEYSEGEIQLINYLNLLLVKNKIILLDESISNLNSDLKTYLLKNVHPLLVKNNFVLTVSHQTKYNNFFENIIKIDSKR